MLTKTQTLDTRSYLITSWHAYRDSDSRNLILPHYEFGMLTKTLDTWSYLITSLACLQGLGIKKPGLISLRVSHAYKDSDSRHLVLSHYDCGMLTGTLTPGTWSHLNKSLKCLQGGTLDSEHQVPSHSVYGMLTGTLDSEHQVPSYYDRGMPIGTQTPDTWSYPITDVKYLQETIFVDTWSYPIGFSGLPSLIKKTSIVLPTCTSNNLK